MLKDEQILTCAVARHAETDPWQAASQVRELPCLTSFQSEPPRRPRPIHLQLGIWYR